MSTPQKILLFAGPLILILLTALAGYTLTNINALSLPISPALSLFTILLPLLTYLTSSFTTRLLRHPNPGTTRQLQPRLATIIPLIIIQAIYNTVIFVQSLQYTVPLTARCQLENRWASLYRTHSEGAIRTIQDALQCCGFAGPRDRPWPFATGREGEVGYVGNGECQRRFGYSRGCMQPWREREITAGGRLAVVAGGVFIVQVIYYISILYPGRSAGWMDTLKAIAGSGTHGGVDNRRNMRGLIEADANGDDARVREVLDREEDEESADTITGTESRRIDNGNASGPRVETSPLLDGWREQGHGR